MKLTYTKGNILTATREAGDPKYYGTVNAKGESNLLYAVKQHLNALGCDLIKKRMHKDGHLVDEMQQYLRVRNRRSKGPHIVLMNDRWAIDGVNDRWNVDGFTELHIIFDYFDLWNADSTIDRDLLTCILSPLYTFHRQPRPGDVNFGYGAMHYKDFERSQCYKANGELKQWLVCPVDGLRYYR